jgi:hypothetical protein
MGRIICPDGTSVATDKFASSMPYEYLVKDIKNGNFTATYRAKCIVCISEVGLFGSFPDLLPYLHSLSVTTEDMLLKEAANCCLRKLSANFTSRPCYENWVG